MTTSSLSGVATWKLANGLQRFWKGGKASKTSTPASYQDRLKNRAVYCFPTDDEAIEEELLPMLLHASLIRKALQVQKVKSRNEEATKHQKI